MGRPEHDTADTEEIMSERRSTKEATVHIHLMCLDRDGKPKEGGGLSVDVSRVPSVGEHIGWDTADYDADDSDVRSDIYRVTHVLHIPVGAASEFERTLAEVWAVEDPDFRQGWPREHLEGGSKQ